MKKRLVSVFVALFMVVLTAGIASAHVNVLPKQSPVNGFERYTIRVPNEQDNPTVKVRVELPTGSTFSSVLPVPGWKFETEKDSSGKVTALVWSGGEIKKGEFFEFGVSVRNPKDEGTVLWKAYQTYSDGTVVNWVGAEGADKPAPAVKLVAAAAGNAPAAAKEEPKAPQQSQPAAAPAPAPASQDNALGTWLGGAALVVSALALVLALRKRGA